MACGDARRGPEDLTEDPAPVPAGESMVIPGVASFVVGVLGLLTGVAFADTGILIAMGVVPLLAAGLVAVAGAWIGSVIRGVWAWLTECADESCSCRAVHLGWCSVHVPEPSREPDELWGDLNGEQR